MKTKNLLLALFLFLFINGNSNHKSSSLNIKLVEHPSVTYIIEFGNGEVFETYRNIRIDNLFHGRHRLKIFKQIVHFDRRNRRRVSEKLVYQGVVNLPANTIVFSQLHHRNLLINRIVQKRVKRHPRRNGGCKAEINSRAFNNLMQSVRNEPFDRGKLDVLTFAIQYNNFSSRQVFRLMNLLAFDSYKLKFAKRAFDSTIDKQNYFIVRNGLVFNSNKRKLTAFIQNRF